MSREPRTTLPEETLRSLNEQLLRVPEGFEVHRKLRPFLDRRRAAFDDPDGRVDWAHGEALAFASLLALGVPVRLTGQDTERGTFSQRHAVLHDARTGERWCALQTLRDAHSPFELHNSPLSEQACLGFEYGYSIQAEDALVLWEAQFGDFVNSAQVIVDQFRLRLANGGRPAASCSCARLRCSGPSTRGAPWTVLMPPRATSVATAPRRPSTSILSGSAGLQAAPLFDDTQEPCVSRLPLDRRERPMEGRADNRRSA